MSAKTFSMRPRSLILARTSARCPTAISCTRRHERDFCSANPSKRRTSSREKPRSRTRRIKLRRSTSVTPYRRYPLPLRGGFLRICTKVLSCGSPLGDPLFAARGAACGSTKGRVASQHRIGRRKFFRLPISGGRDAARFGCRPAPEGASTSPAMAACPKMALLRFGVTSDLSPQCVE